MRKIKKFAALFLALTMCLGLLAGCDRGDTDSNDPGSQTPQTGEDNPSSQGGGQEQKDPYKVGTCKENDMSDLKGAIVYCAPLPVSDPTNKLFWRGVKDELETMGDYNLVDMSPAEFKATDQIDKLLEAIAQDAGALLVSPITDSGYDEVWRKAKEKDIKIISWNGRANPEYRDVFINQCDPSVFVGYAVASAVLYTTRDPFNNNPDDLIPTAVASAHEYGKKIKIGVISTLPDAAVQSAWVNELENAAAAYDVDIEFDIKFTNNDQAQGAVLIDAFAKDEEISGVICLASTVITTVCEEIIQLGSDIKITGCMWPGTIVDYMPEGIEDQYDAVIPWGLGWDFEIWGSICGAAAARAINGEFENKVGAVLEVNPTAAYPDGRKLEVVPTTKPSEEAAGGTEIFSQGCVVYTVDNIDKYVEQENSVVK